jgi:molybdopterin molybdotransferase
MLSVHEALERVLAHARPLAPATISLGESLGRTLAEDIASDIDSPPYNKSMVDGYAVRASDLANGRAELEVIEEIMAGAVPTRPIAVGTCSRIMTGAPIPEAADAVVMQEQTERLTSRPTRVRINDERFRAGQNILSRGVAMHLGDVVLRSGRPIRPAEIALLAEVGRAEVLAIPAPRVAVLSTGNELVSAAERPTAGQIRNSNGPMLVAAVQQAGALPVNLGIARDEPDELRERLGMGLKENVLVISGGVSTGVLDLVPGLVAELGVRQVFHRIRMKPGKPLWFGASNDTLVFGLPGNPVSSFVCFELFVKPALTSLAGREEQVTRRIATAKLAAEFAHRGNRPTFQPAILEAPVGDRESGDGGRLVTPLPWAGSADLRGLVDANALIIFPAGDRTFAADETVEVLRLDE